MVSKQFSLSIFLSPTVFFFSFGTLLWVTPEIEGQGSRINYGDELFERSARSGKRKERRRFTEHSGRETDENVKANCSAIAL